jgi:hypothetical protein
MVPLTSASRLGIDCGGVLCESADTDGAAASTAPPPVAARMGTTRRNLPIEMQARGPTDACVSTVTGLVGLFGAENVFVVSKCGAHVQRATVIWLRHYDVFQRTGLRPENVVFCQNRSGIEGEGTGITWGPVSPPTGRALEELCEATGRAASTLLSFFGDAKLATAAVPLPGLTSAHCGKGVVARQLRLTHFIDDRAECLHSVFFEGWLAAPEGSAGGAAAGAMLRAPGAIGGLATIHFGPHVRCQGISRHADRDSDLQRLLPLAAPRKKRKPPPRDTAAVGEPG